MIENFLIYLTAFIVIFCLIYTVSSILETLINKKSKPKPVTIKIEELLKKVDTSKWHTFKIDEDDKEAKISEISKQLDEVCESGDWFYYKKR